MANPEHLVRIRDVASWNAWRRECPFERPDLRNADLVGADLHGVDLSEAETDLVTLWRLHKSGVDLSELDLDKAADLRDAHLQWAKLQNANIRGANLQGAILTNADLTDADARDANLRHASLARAILYRANLTSATLADACLSAADLRESIVEVAVLERANLTAVNAAGAKFEGADLSWADLTGADFSGALLRRVHLRGAHIERVNLTGVDLTGALFATAVLVQSKLDAANLTRSWVYGLSVWDVSVDGTIQKDLRITPPSQPSITTDSIEVAQFVYLILHNTKIRNVIDTVARKAVLILGRFTPESRKAVLDAIRDKLRDLDFVPIVFDFEKPDQRDFTETIQTLAGICRFVIADITNPRSSPLELQAIIPNYMIPFVPIIEKDEEPFAMFRDLKTKHREWVLDPLRYDSVANLIELFERAVLEPALDVERKLLALKAAPIHMRDL